MADFGGADLEAFRAQTRAWLEANYPPSLKEPMKGEDDAPWGGRKTSYSNPDIALWTQRMGEKASSRSGGLMVGSYRPGSVRLARPGEAAECPPARLIFGFSKRVRRAV